VTVADGEQALVRAPLTQPARVRDDPPPRLELARSLDEAGPDAVVVLDRHGDLVPWPRLHRWAVVQQALAFSVLALASLLAVEWLGWMGLATPIAAVLTLAGGRRRSTWEWRAMALIQSGRDDEAEALCRSIVERPSGSTRRARRQRAAWAHRCLAIIANRRGDAERALVEVRAALPLVAADRPQAVNELLVYQEVRLLADLGRMGEARARFEGRPQPTRGEVLIVQHGMTELYLAFAEGKLQIDDDVLWARAQRALRLSGGAQLLALCAWAFLLPGARRDEEMARHLLDEAVDRFVPWMKRSAPSLWSWVEGQRGAKLPDGSAEAA
jgi:hypothetical protein